MNTLMLKSSLLGVLLLGAVAQARADAPTEAQAVLECMRGNVPRTLRIQDLELSTVADADSKLRSMRARLYAQQEKTPHGDQLRAMLRVMEPSTLAGAAYLVREAGSYAEEGLYVWLPSVRRVRRVSGEFADGALLGTDFSYNDFKQLQGAFGGLAAAKQALPETVDGRPVWLLAFKPEPGVKTTYSEVQSWIDQKTCVPLKMTYFSGGKLRKQLTVPTAALKQTDKYWYPSLIEMRDLQVGSTSTLRVKGLLPDDKLASRYFNPKLFYMPGQ